MNFIGNRRYASHCCSHHLFPKRSDRFGRLDCHSWMARDEQSQLLLLFAQLQPRLLPPESCRLNVQPQHQLNHELDCQQNWKFDFENDHQNAFIASLLFAKLASGCRLAICCFVLFCFVLFAGFVVHGKMLLLNSNKLASSPILTSSALPLLLPLRLSGDDILRRPFLLKAPNGTITRLYCWTS